MAERRSRAEWLKRAHELPETPGVYLMKDAEGAVVYVGKAKSLRARVRSYFQEGTSDFRAFIGLLAGLLREIETVVTRSEKEALLLERELIRRHEPRFNVIWKDDKQFLCLRLDPAHEWPWVQVVRNLGRDGARYFGPFHSATSARQTLRVVNRHFQLRTCRDSVLYNRTRPCLEHQIGRCPAPCVLDVDRDRYLESVDDVTMFLEGKGDQLQERLAARMWAASERLDFEVAAHYRDQMTAVERTLEKQRIALPSLLDQDVFGVYQEGTAMCVALLVIRGGRVENVITQLVEDGAFDAAALLESFILQRYAGDGEGARGDEAEVPSEILVPFELEGSEPLSELLGERRGRKVTVKVPQRGDRASLLQMAHENAQHAFHEKQRASGAIDRTLAGLKDRLRLRRVPLRIECYDISNLGGQLIVGSGVSFVRAVPNKNGYRRYRVKSAAGQDDFASMYEVLSRRAKRGLADGDLPDLIVIDGGKGQLSSAKAALDDAGVVDVDLVSLAKSRVLESDEPDSAPRSPERVFVPGAKDPIVLRQDSPELLLLARIRDEAHRFAITFHKSLRKKVRLRSALEDIPGIGPVRRTRLLEGLGSVKRVREASEAELAAVPGVGAAAAARVFAFFHGGAAGAEGAAGIDPDPRDEPLDLAGDREVAEVDPGAELLREDLEPEGAAGVAEEGDDDAVELEPGLDVAALHPAEHDGGQRQESPRRARGPGDFGAAADGGAPVATSARPAEGTKKKANVVDLAQEKP